MTWRDIRDIAIIALGMSLICIGIVLFATFIIFWLPWAVSQ